ncbi:MAG: DUF2085 domain-containing protein [Candidatus Bathyarchaeota archaeon]
MLAHRHWITVNAFNRELHLCARCSGIVLGFLGLEVILTIVTPLMSYSMPTYIVFLISFLLATPSIVDWITQSLDFRQSNNGVRLKVGLLEGFGVGFLSLADVSIITKLIILAAFSLSVVSIGFLGRKLTQKVFST